MMTSHSERREWALMGHAHTGGSRRGRREWWELIILRHVAKHAAAWHVAKEGLQFEPTMRALRIRMLALGEVLRDLRKASRKWALRQIIRVSEELGLYEGVESGHDEPAAVALALARALEKMGE